MPFKQIIFVGTDGANTNQQKLANIKTAANQAIRINAKKVLWIETFGTYTSQLYECETLSAIGEFVDWTTMDSNESDDLADKGW